MQINSLLLVILVIIRCEYRPVAQRPKPDTLPIKILSITQIPSRSANDRPPVRPFENHCARENVLFVFNFSHKWLESDKLPSGACQMLLYDVVCRYTIKTHRAYIVGTKSPSSVQRRFDPFWFHLGLGAIALHKYHATDGGGHNISRNKLKVIGYGAQCMSYRKLGANWSLFVVGAGTCRFNPDLAICNISDWGILPKKEDALAFAVWKIGPVAVSLNAEPKSFQLYQSGIYDSADCDSSKLNHAVLVVGYTPTYWIIKNWWGTWGENGYMRIVRGKNMCGIANYAAYCTIK